MNAKVPRDHKIIMPPGFAEMRNLGMKAGHFIYWEDLS